MISAAMTGAVGAIQAWWLTYIDPPSMFDMGIAVKAFVILLLGGAGTVLGPVIGAFAVELLANFTWSELLNWHLGSDGADHHRRDHAVSRRLHRRAAPARLDRAPLAAGATARGRVAMIAVQLAIQARTPARRDRR